jgi:hypothetical protein
VKPLLTFAFGRWLCVLLLPISAIVSTESLAQYLTGTAREDFIKSTANGCMRAKINDEEEKIIPNSLFEGHCRCYANALADKIKIIDAILQSCCQSSTSCPSTNCLAYSIAVSSSGHTSPIARLIRPSLSMM